MKLTLFLFATILAFVSTARIKTDDMSKLKAEGEKFVAERLDEFKQAMKKHHLTMEDRVHFLSLLEYVKKAYAEISELEDKITNNQEDMAIIPYESLSRNDIQQLHNLMVDIDENQDDSSYYFLGYAIEWIEKRLLEAQPSYILKDMMREARDELVIARYLLHRYYIQEFLSGVKQVKMLTSEGKGNENSQGIANIVKKLINLHGDFQYVASSAVSRIEEMTDSRLFSGKL